LVDYAAAAVSAFPFPFPGFERPQATFAIFPSTSIPPWADRPSAVLSARERVLKLTNAQSTISRVLSIPYNSHFIQLTLRFQDFDRSDICWFYPWTGKD
jgi:hypothetical protein